VVNSLGREGGRGGGWVNNKKTLAKEGGNEGGREGCFFYLPVPMLQGRERSNDEEGARHPMLLPERVDESGGLDGLAQPLKKGGREEGRERGRVSENGQGTRCFSQREWMKAAVWTVLPSPCRREGRKGGREGG